MTPFWIIGFFLFCGTIATPAIYPVVGAQVTKIEEYPYVTKVEALSYNHYWIHSCSASIITSRFVLSAARCFYGLHNIPRIIRIRAGISKGFHDGEVVYVENVLNHPNYCHRTKANDISVVRIARALPSLPSIQQAVLVAHGSTIPDNLPVELVGWAHSIQLRNLTVHTINNRSCAQRYTGSGFKVTENMICSRLLDNSRDSYLFDIGGPMVYQGILIGVVSECTFRLDSDYNRLPLVSTSVASYTRWVTETAKL